MKPNRLASRSGCILALGFMALARDARAIITVSQVNGGAGGPFPSGQVPGFQLTNLTNVGGSLSPPSPPPGMQTSLTANFYFFAGTSGGVQNPAPPAYYSFQPILLDPNLAYNQTGRLDNTVRLLVSTNLSVAPPAARIVLLTVAATTFVSAGTPIAGSTSLLPIAGVGGEPCTDTNCYRLQGSLLNGGAPYTNPYYGVPYLNTGQYLEIDLDWNQICSVYTANTGGTITNCQASSIVPPAAGAPVAMGLQLNLYPVPSASAPANIPTPAPTGTAIDSTSGYTLNVNLQVDTPTFSCPPPQTPNLYLPRDGQILLNETLFGLSNQAAGTAPIQTIYVVANDTNFTQAPLVFEPNFAALSANQLLVGAWNNGSTGAPITGFTNARNPNDHLYNVGFLVQDATGTYIPPQGECLMSGVQTGQISALFKSTAESSSLCFIATATHGSPDAWGVRTLRQFRDQMLNRWAWGRQAVAYYYVHSPPVADWINAHPIAKLPVRVLLTPIEGLVWCILNLRVLLGGASLGILYGFWRRRRLKILWGRI